MKLANDRLVERVAGKRARRRRQQGGRRGRHTTGAGRRARARRAATRRHGHLARLTRLSTLLPVLTLCRVAVLRHDAEHAVAKLLGRMLEVAAGRLDHASAVDKAERAYEAAHLALGVQRDRVAHVQEAAALARVLHFSRTLLLTLASWLDLFWLLCCCCCCCCCLGSTRQCYRFVLFSRSSCCCSFRLFQFNIDNNNNNNPKNF